MMMLTEKQGSRHTVLSVSSRTKPQRFAREELVRNQVCLAESLLEYRLSPSNPSLRTAIADTCRCDFHRKSSIYALTAAFGLSSLE